MKAFFVSIILSTTLVVHSQYYYTDIMSAKELSKLQASYITNKVKTITATGTDKSGVKASDFSEYHEVKENGSLLRVVKMNGLTKTITTYQFNTAGKLVTITDSTAAVQNHTTYVYDNAGYISKVENKVTDADGSFSQTEVHSWQYASNGKPLKMWRSFDGINSNDSMEVQFIIDENGNIGEEKTYKRGKEAGFLYYYYDEKNQLSDIVRYNTKLKKLLPDIMFEYDEVGNIVQKITTTSSQSMGYLIWRYIFNERGLKTREALFNNNKQLTGRIDFKYTFEK
ncbi:MAG: hypothetical protein RIR12_256 [Bacteroidota bacterium]|jgi:antitoxin component YwqK of YwqJK toxin-antitoxin module